MHALIIGRDGTVGRALCTSLSARGDRVSATTRRRRHGGTALYLDLNDDRSEEVSLPEAHVAFFCAGITRFSECRERPDVARRVNVTTPAALAARLVRSGTQVVLLSTSAVLDCAEPRMKPERARRPASHYGRLKAEAEERFLALGGRATVLRLTKVLTADARLFTEWIAALSRGERVRAFSDLRFSPLRVCEVVRALVAIADSGESGLFQISSAADISYADAASYIALRLGVSADLIDVRSAVECGIPAEEVTSYTSLDTERLSVLSGFVPPDPCEVIEQVFGSALACARASRRTAAAPPAEA